MYFIHCTNAKILQERTATGWHFEFMFCLVISLTKTKILQERTATRHFELGFFFVISLRKTKILQERTTTRWHFQNRFPLVISLTNTNCCGLGGYLKSSIFYHGRLRFLRKSNLDEKGWRRMECTTKNIKYIMYLNM